MAKNTELDLFSEIEDKKIENTKTNSQIKSKERVANRGEVFTAEREVKAMCDLVKNETERIDSRFLEPACGDGNFLYEILKRKLEVVTKIYKKNPFEWKRHSFIAVSSIYGVEIMADNVQVCRNRLFNFWFEEYSKICKENDETTEDFLKSIQFLLERNILQGNALSLLQVDSKQNDITDKPIIFSEWTLVTGNKVKRRDFRLDLMLQNDDEVPSLFSDFDSETDSYISLPEKEFPLTDFWRIYVQS